MKEYKLKNTTFFDEFAEVAETISEEEWAFFDYTDDISDQIMSYMERNNISRVSLAKRLGTSKAFITKVLKGNSNLTFKTFTKLLEALGAKPVTRIVEKDIHANWYLALKGGRHKSHIPKWMGEPKSIIKQSFHINDIKEKDVA